ncbi:MAG: SBBP repeat-containing protein [Promethearchaeota archaeon]
MLQREFPKLATVPELNDEWYVTWAGNAQSGEGAHDLAIDSSGDIYVAGYTFSYSAGHADLGLVKFDKNGDIIWNTTFGYLEQDRARAVAIDSDDNVYIAGFTDTIMGFEKDHDFCVVKYYKNGTQAWNSTWGSSLSEEGYDMVIDSLDNIYIAGFRYVEPNDFCFVKYNKSGNVQLSGVRASPGWDQCYGIALDSAGNIYLAGDKYGGGSFGYDMYLVKYNSSGNFQWERIWGGIGYESAKAIAVDNSDNIYLAGVTTTFSEAKDDICLVKYNSSGTQIWNATWGGDEEESCSDITLDSSGNIFLVGKSDIDANEYSSVTIAKFNNLGEIQWYDTWEDGWSNDIQGIALDISGNVFIANDFGGMTLVKFSSAPKIEIESPTTNKKCGKIAPNYTLSISEPNLDETWYTLDEGVTNITFTGLTGQINQAEWDKFSNGTTINMIFYAKDTFDNIGFANVAVIKEITSGGRGTPFIPGYYIFIIIGIIGIISITLARRLKINEI